MILHKRCLWCLWQISCLDHDHHDNYDVRISWNDSNPEANSPQIMAILHPCDVFFCQNHCRVCTELICLKPSIAEVHSDESFCQNNPTSSFIKPRLFQYVKIVSIQYLYWKGEQDLKCLTLSACVCVCVWGGVNPNWWSLIKFNVFVASKNTRLWGGVGC